MGITEETTLQENSKLISNVYFVLSDGSVCAQFSPAVPHSKSQMGSITAIAGKNCTGKTETLKRIADALSSGRYYPDVISGGVGISVELGDDGTTPPKSHFLQLLPFANVRNAKLESKRYQRDPYGRKQRIYLSASSEFFLRHLDSNSEVDRKQWTNNKVYRADFVQKHFKTKAFIPCNQEDPLVTAFQNATGRPLYITRRRKKHWADLDPALSFGPDSLLDLNRWSHGQQHLFVSMLELNYLRPTVLLIDEPESHLHPEYITHFLQFARTMCRQILCVTHHPHVMFSLAVEAVYFVSIQWPQPEQPLRPVEVDKDDFAPTSITVESLPDEMEKITRVYDLFSHPDTQMLRLASIVEQEFEAQCYKDIVQSLLQHRENVGNDPWPDLQTSQFVTILKSMDSAHRDSLDILDFGAGIGRVEREFDKIGLDEIKRKLRWVLYEPDSKHVTNLIETFRNDQRFRIVDSLEKVEEDLFDLVLLTNVLHHLNPKQFEEMLFFVASHLSTPEASLVILDTYPLLRTERFAVAYEMKDLESLLRARGWRVESGSRGVRGGLVQAYWIIATLRNMDPVSNRQESIALIEAQWQAIAKRTAQSYADKRTVYSASDYQQLKSHLHVLASIASYNSGVWSQ